MSYNVDNTSLFTLRCYCVIQHLWFYGGFMSEDYLATSKSLGQLRIDRVVFISANTE
jgi:hypothetical protein